MVSNESLHNAGLKAVTSADPSASGFRIVFLRGVLALIAAVAPIVALYQWYSSVGEARVDLAYAAGCLVLFLYLRRGRNVEMVGTVALVLSYVIFTFGYLMVPHATTRIPAFFPLVASALFLKGERKGFVWLGLILATIFVLPITHSLGIGFSESDAIHSAISLLALFFIVLFYERARTRGVQSELEAAVLRASEERMGALYANQQGFLLVVSAAGIVQSASESIARVLGFAPAELVGVNVLDLVHPDDLASMAQIFSALAQPNSEPVNVEMRVRHKNGEILTIEGDGANLLENPLIHGIVLNAHDISMRKQMEDDLRRLAWTDALTGLHNRRHFFELAEQETARSQRYGRSLAVLMIDIDHFKAVNDTYGHQAGDAVLQKLSAVAGKVSRGSDIIRRIGGEEFALLLPETEAHQAAAAAERLRVALAETAVQAPGAPALHVTVSIGVTTLMPADGTFDTILARADAALYAAKGSGRNRICTGEDVLGKRRIVAAA